MRATELASTISCKRTEIRVKYSDHRFADSWGDWLLQQGEEHDVLQICTFNGQMFELTPGIWTARCRAAAMRNKDDTYQGLVL